MISAPDGEILWVYGPPGAVHWVRVGQRLA